MAKVAIISGSPGASSRLNGVIDRLQERLESKDMDVTLLNVRGLPPEDLMYTKFDSSAIGAFNAAVEEADAIIVATPVYKASYTGVLKAYLDMLPQKALVGKVVLPTAIGGTIAHLLMIDYALKPVLAALGATNMQQGIYVLDTQVQRSEDGAAFSFSLSDDIAERIDAAAETFAEEVEWNARRKAK